MRKVPFNIRFKANDYTRSEVAQFFDCISCDRPFNGDLNDRYLAFLEQFESGKVKPSTLVDLDVLTEFYRDVENRSSIDYQEVRGYRSDDPYRYDGGKYFYDKAQKLKSYLTTLNQ